MREFIPSYIYDTIRDRYLAGVTNAELAFEYNKGDEDALTGALGQSLFTPPTLISDRQGNVYQYSITHHKIRGRGPNAPEKRLGADGIFQIDVRDANGNILKRKGLLFQCKKEWVGTDAKLGQQAKLLAVPNTKGIVIDFTSKGYSTCAATIAARTLGHRTQIESSEFSRLAQTLADQFLPCLIGIEGMYYDADRELLIDPTMDRQSPPESDTHLLQTRVHRVI